MAKIKDDCLELELTPRKYQQMMMIHLFYPYLSCWKIRKRSFAIFPLFY